MSKAPKEKPATPVNTDPTGTVGAVTRHGSGDDDFTVVARGGQNFLARMQKLVELRDDQESSYAKLQIGRDAAAALSAAQAKLADAEEQNQKARAALADAQAKAKDIVDKATQQAADTVKSAQEAKQKVETEAQQVRKDADAYAAKVRADVDKAREDTIERGNQAKAAETAAIKAKGDYDDAAKKAALSASQADARAKDLQSRLDRLNAAIRDVTT